MSRKTRRNQELGQISRREFLRNAGWLIGGAALGSMAFLNACKSTAKPSTTYTTANATDSKTVLSVDTLSPANSKAVISPTTSTTTTATTPASESLGDILGKSAGVSTLKYDQIMTASGSSMTQKVYVKQNKMRTEMTSEGQTIIVLVNFDTKKLYNYWPAENMAMKGDMSEAGTPASDQAESSASYNPTILGTETMDGKVCLKVQYTANRAIITQWIWKQYGLPVHMESVAASGTSVVEYKNYDFSDIADSMFELINKCSLCKYGDLCS